MLGKLGDLLEVFIALLVGEHRQEIPTYLADIGIIFAHSKNGY